MTTTHAQWMGVALAASEAVWGRASPNPTVGAVVLDAAGELVATGVTEPAGGRHAEAVALDLAGERARGGTVIATLEPCNHHGRTGPCSERIVDAGIATVVYGASDPNPLATGGALRLREAGVVVIQDVVAEQEGTRRDVRDGPLGGWLFRQERGRPRVTWKFAATLDGRSAAADGTSKWITGTAAREHTVARRSRYDAIVVGTGTLVADDPSLTAREADGSLALRQPLRCVMGLGEVPRDARVRGTDDRFRHLRTRDPAVAVEALGDVVEVLLEGGPRLAGAFLAAGMVDRVEAYVAPLLLGDGATALSGSGVTTISAAHRYKMSAVTRLGDDVLLELEPREG